MIELGTFQLFCSMSGTEELELITIAHQSAAVAISITILHGGIFLIIFIKFTALSAFYGQGKIKLKLV